MEPYRSGGDCSLGKFETMMIDVSYKMMKENLLSLFPTFLLQQYLSTETMRNNLHKRIIDFSNIDMNDRKLFAATTFFQTCFIIHFLRIINQSLAVFITALVQVRYTTDYYNEATNAILVIRLTYTSSITNLSFCIHMSFL